MCQFLGTHHIASFILLVPENCELVKAIKDGNNRCRSTNWNQLSGGRGPNSRFNGFSSNGLFFYGEDILSQMSIGDQTFDDVVEIFTYHLERTGSVFNHEAIREHHPYASQIATLEEELQKSHIDHFFSAELRMTDRPKPAEATVFGQ
uniref:Uncharacterized protein n=1 Tax=Ditylenchus dipsaci TaxID=166011 RepID=A0A915DFN6_9BILA